MKFYNQNSKDSYGWKYFPSMLLMFSVCVKKLNKSVNNLMTFSIIQTKTRFEALSLFSYSVTY